MSFENSQNSDDKLLAHPNIKEEKPNCHARYFLKHDIFNNNQTATAVQPGSSSFVQGGPEQQQQHHILNGDIFTNINGNEGNFHGENFHASTDASSFDDFKKRKKLKVHSLNNSDNTYSANSNMFYSDEYTNYNSLKPKVSSSQPAAASFARAKFAESFTGTTAYNPHHRNSAEMASSSLVQVKQEMREMSSESRSESRSDPSANNLVCVVCAAPANGYNFDAVTCESCKAFFRRNAFRSVHLFHCSSSGKCVINPVTRKKCKKCRIMKCFETGMRRDWIMTDVEREEKRKKIQENRRRKQTDSSQLQCSDDESNPDSLLEQNGDFHASYGSASLLNNSFGESSLNSRGGKVPIRRRRRRRQNSMLENNRQSAVTKSQPQTPQPQQHSGFAMSSEDSAAQHNGAFTNHLASPKPYDSINNNEHFHNSKLQAGFNSYLDNTSLPNGSISRLGIYPSHEASHILGKNYLPNNNSNNSNNSNNNTTAPNEVSGSSFDYQYNNNNNSNNNQAAFESFEHSNPLRETARQRMEAKNLSGTTESEPKTWCTPRVHQEQQQTPHKKESRTPDQPHTNLNQNQNNESSSSKCKFKYNFKKFILKSFEYMQKKEQQQQQQSLAQLAATSGCSSQEVSLATGQTTPETSDGPSPDPSPSSRQPLSSIQYTMPQHHTKLIEDLTKAYRDAIRLVRAQGLPKHSEDINTTINLTELAVRRIINFLKLVIDFNDVNHELMIVLLKNSMMSLLQIHGVNSYDRETNSFMEPDTDDTPFSAESLETVYGKEIYELTIDITRTLCNVLYPDKTHIKMLILVCLFDPSCPGLTLNERHNIKAHQNKHVKLLYAYLCERLGIDRAEQAFATLIGEMNKINELSKWFKSTVDEKTDKDLVRPLMKEIFNMTGEGSGDWKSRSAGQRSQHGNNNDSSQNDSVDADFKSPDLESVAFSAESWLSYSNQRSHSPPSNETADHSVASLDL